MFDDRIFGADLMVFKAENVLRRMTFAFLAVFLPVVFSCSGCTDDSTGVEGKAGGRGRTAAESLKKRPGVPARNTLTILMNGSRAADERFKPGGRQPAVLFRIEEDDGECGLLLVDAGDDERIFTVNFEAWLASADLDSGRIDRGAVLLSHGHTFGPPDPGAPDADRSDGLNCFLERCGSSHIYAPNLDVFCRLGLFNRAWLGSGICDGKGIDLSPGVRRLEWSDGTLSGVHFVTYPVALPETGVPFSPDESVTVVPDGDGCLVYSVCSHMRRPDAEKTPPPFHAAYIVREAMDGGEVPRSPIRTLVTGACGMMRTFSERDDKTTPDGTFDRAAFINKLRTMKNDLGIERVYLVHCALVRRDPDQAQALFREVFGENVEPAYPGAVIPIAPRVPSGALPAGVGQGAEGSR